MVHHRYVSQVKNNATYALQIMNIKTIWLYSSDHFSIFTKFNTNNQGNE